ncbi:hypothetical protein AERO_03665 [Aeromicrobium fastidiosum]|uniref:hypothetical protein n=1 Tax=Aeromicrobium fastidiosum TaxID=52699 RepID=UPI0020233DAF|nr:hypothetical protein [Aeromicrobium fastidiosum]MCL8250471.1 hypothetical protein [Aeromicrobium fastidiosum]
MDGLPVVLGVRYGQHLQVAAFAAGEAARRRSALRVVHVTDDPATSLSLFDDVTAVAAPHRGLVVEHATVRGDATQVLLDESRLASVVVVGADDTAWIARAIGTEISRAVVVRADTPVIVVPEAPSRRPRPSRVVVALDAGHQVDGQLAFAMHAAVLRAEPLHVVHAAGVGGDHATSSQRGYLLEQAVDRWRCRFPQVTVHTDVEPDHPVHACLAASVHASVLVVGQPLADHHRPASRAVVSRLLRRSAAPVAVVPRAHDRAGQPA